MVAFVLLAATLAFAVVRPRGLSEAVAAVPAAVLVVALGIVPLDAAGDALRRIGPTVGFLAAILVFGHLCAEADVFTYLGGRAATLSKGSPHRLLALIVALAAAVTATLTLDATVVLLTPVVLTTTAALGVIRRPQLYACTRLANSGSLLLPVSNLTNLLAFSASGLSFGRFTGLMVLPWVLVCVAEWLGLRTFFRRDLARPAANPRPPVPAAPRYALSVLAVTVGLFVLTSSVGVSPAFAALAGCVALLVPRVRSHGIQPVQLVREASPGFVLFVFSLSVVVDGVTRHGLGGALSHLVPSTTSFAGLLALAALAAVLANVLNNLPATLALLPLVAGTPALTLAVLLGVNIGPNAAYPGSLATLLWRRLLPADDKPDAAQFHRLGLLTVPPLIVLATGALWAALQVLGPS
ncbi:MAG: arsenic transporter [Jatrophihabitans endophyticus]|nr:arsenic transporter [Jatrophihabitans endophyticus]